MSRMLGAIMGLATPFVGVKKKPTLKHRPLLWENMLGTVYARNIQGKTEYFDYNWKAAHEFAQVSRHTDLRLARNTSDSGYEGSPRRGQWVMYGIPPQES